MIFKINSFFLFIVFALSSNDIFLNLSVNDFNIRTLYFFELIILFLYLNKFINLNQNKFFLIYLWPLLYLLLSLIFYKNLIYEFLFIIWIFASVLFIPLIYLLCKSLSTKLIYNLYLNSFFVISIFGFIQFLFGIFSIDILITQKWPNGIPRINGLNYEPSFFATYLLIIWSSLTYILLKNVMYFKKRFMKRYLFITLVIFLSTSRMALLFMFLSFSFLFIYRFCINLKSQFILKNHLIIFFLFLILLVFVLLIFYQNNFLLNGLGILTEYSHSVDDRLKYFNATFEIFKSNFFVGVGFYNLPIEISYLIDCNSWKMCQGMGTWIEVFAASGFSFIVIVWFVLNFFFYKRSSIRDQDNKIIYESLLFSLIILIAMLSLNQNIFRPYFWILLGVLFTLKNKIYEKI